MHIAAGVVAVAVIGHVAGDGAAAGHGHIRVAEAVAVRIGEPELPIHRSLVHVSVAVIINGITDFCRVWIDCNFGVITICCIKDVPCRRSTGLSSEIHISKSISIII